MKRRFASLLAAVPLLAAAASGAAADLPVDRATATARPGAFAGARLRLALGPAKRGRLRAGLAVAPVRLNLQPDGVRLNRIGEGMEVGLAGDEKVRLSFGGTPLSRLAQGGEAPEGRKLGVSTVSWVAIGVGAAAALWLGATYLVYVNSDDRNCRNC